MQLISLLVASVIATSSNAATIADLIRNNPSLSQTAAQISKNPSWSSAGAFTVFVAPDASINAAKAILPSSSVGALTVAGVTGLGTHYTTLLDVDNVNRCVFDNYNPGGPDATTVHMRYGLGEVLGTSVVQADNGLLYILQGPIIPSTSVSKTLASKRAMVFWDYIVKAGMDGVVENLKDSTIFFPDDNAIAPARAKLDSLTKNQLQHVIASNILGRLLLSTAVGGNPEETLNPGFSVPVSFANDKINVGNTSSFFLADVFAQVGNMHQVTALLIPNDPIPDTLLFKENPRIGGNNTTMNTKPNAAFTFQPTLIALVIPMLFSMLL